MCPKDERIVLSFGINITFVLHCQFIKTFIMKTKNLNLLKSFSFFLIAIFATSCASLTGYQDGKSIGEGNGEIMASLNLSQSPSFNEIEDSSNIINIPRFSFPNIEVGGKYGVTEKLDVFVRLNTNLNFNAGMKYQVVGDRSSQFALGVGGEIGTFGLITSLWNVQIPLYASYHPTEMFSVYLSPRYIYQFTTFAGLDGWSYVGGNFGLLIGNKNKFGIDIGIYKVGANGTGKIGLTTFGFGGRFGLGDNYPDSTNNKKSKKKRKSQY